MNVEDAVKSNRSMPAGDTESEMQTDEVIRSVAQLSISDSCGTIRCSDTEDLLQRVKDQHKISMKNRFKRLNEGVNLLEDQTHLNKIYTELLFLIEDVRCCTIHKYSVEMVSSPHTPIKCNHIFRASAEENKDQKIKTVVTKGIAGIGKSVSVQKFILDWAEGEDNQDVDFVFVLPFRKLNLIKETQYSLHRLLLDFHPELQGLDSETFEKCKVLFILDGFDQSTIKLMFSEEQKVSDVNTSSSVSLLLLSLIRGDLLPSALIWITTRLAAADQIPPKYISRVTEIQGFNDAQQEEYFRKRISDEDEASRIISHIRRSRSLHHLCHIPAFCCVSATVLQNILKQDDTAETPQTLTEMYIHFLLMQIHTRKQKFEENDPEKLLQSSREVIVKLSELAYNQLMKGNVMFYEEDLRESGMDVMDASVCSVIFRDESVFPQRRVFCFVHLSFQEFLAAFHNLYHAVWNDIHTVLLPFLPFPEYSATNSLTLDVLLDAAVDDSLQSENGRLDLYLRFLLGVSLESNQRLLQDLLTRTVKSSETITHITQKIQDKLKADRDLSNDTRINLFLCLLEMKDQIQSRDLLWFFQPTNHYLRLSTYHCSVIAYVIQISEEVLDEIDLSYFFTTQDGTNRLIPALINCRKTKLSDQILSDQHCESLSSCLQSPNSSLRELDLQKTKLQDSGVKILSDGLKSSNCRLEKLNLHDCNLTVRHCESLSSCLQSSNSSLRELDLSNNKIRDSGVKILSKGLKSSNCRLEKLSLYHCQLTDECCESLSSCLQFSTSSLRDLNLKYNNLHSGVKILSDGLMSPNCRLEKLSLKACSVSDGDCASLSSCLQSSNSSLRELDLSNNDLRDSGVKILSDGLKSSYCRLEKLSLSGNFLTDKGCESLSSCLQSSNSSLRDLDLRNNEIQDSGVKILSDGLKSSYCRLEKLSLFKCQLTDGCCESLSSCLQFSNSSLRDLNLNYNDLHDSGVKILTDGLKSPNCRLEKLSLISSVRLTDECCETLSTFLQSSTSSLRDLDLSNNEIQDSGVKILSDGLKSPTCQLEILRLVCRKMTGKGRDLLSSALQSSPSRLREITLCGKSLIKPISVLKKCGQHHEADHTNADEYWRCAVM